jgi:biotin transport system substrate-specific component
MQREALVQRLPIGGVAAREAGIVVLGAVATALAAQVKIPLEPVPATLQTLAVLMCGALMGARRAALSQAAYLMMGLAGAPVFAKWMSGPAAFMGPTGGYLLAFIPAAALVGWLSERGWTKNLVSSAAALVLGTLVIYALGLLQLSLFIGPSAAFAMGVLPFLGIDTLKVIVGAAASTGVTSLTGLYRKSDPV